MEFINKVEIQGFTSKGNAKTARIEDKVFSHKISVRTERHYTLPSGEPTIDIIWFDVVVIPGAGSIPADWEPRTSAPVHIVGHLQYFSNRYEVEPGTDTLILTVLADEIEYLNEKED